MHANARAHTHRPSGFISFVGGVSIDRGRLEPGCRGARSLHPVAILDSPAAFVHVNFLIRTFSGLLLDVYCAPSYARGPLRGALGLDFGF